MLVRKPAPAKGCAAAVGAAVADVLELGVTVTLAGPHAVMSRVAMHATAARARLQGEGRVTSPRIAEPSRLSRCRYEDNPTHGNALRASCHALGPGTRRAARRAHRPRACHQCLSAQRAAARVRGGRLVGSLRGERADLCG